MSPDSTRVVPMDDVMHQPRTQRAPRDIASNSSDAAMKTAMQSMMILAMAWTRLCNTGQSDVDPGQAGIQTFVRANNANESDTA
jgi:hypothetical protein